MLTADAAVVGGGRTLLRCGVHSVDLGRTAVMGVVNVTPDSFSDGGHFFEPQRAIAHAHRMVEEGADIIDIGGESTRPGAGEISEAEEIDRVLPVIEAIAPALTVPVSIDTSRPGVMRAAVASGASLINDVRALRSPGALEAAVALGVPVCLMHMRGAPRTMQNDPVYDDVVAEVGAFLLARREACLAAGIRPDAVLVDPGFGFGKTAQHNLSLLRGLRTLADTTQSPVVAGLSRKSMIGALLGLPVDRRMHASVALALIAAGNGAAMVRVHDVEATRDALRMAEVVGWGVGAGVSIGRPPPAATQETASGTPVVR